eukprot:CAMPEP_0117429958 /NCGR_PEP_ID=MMETSP0758-20121206/9486_1 /TAXON_ID=63605 /ORGANISM="Percolomonas cosmopolitus, Strain AE-1 (ATCC 50343)" /LENGTH=1154 /DNA_ID=CAMNT_0005217475 /DNA_START=13 /DNA_END=3473 /DNA_ORIENTATION=-
MIEKEVRKEEDQANGETQDIPAPPPIVPNKGVRKQKLTTDEEHEKEVKALEYTPSSSSSYTYYSKPESKNETGFSGLSNQGATCYLNSLLQSLYMTPTVRKTLYEWRYKADKHGTAERSIPYQLQKLFARMDCSKKRAQKTTDLTTSFGWNRSDSFVQHDVNELCHILFDAIDKSFYPQLYKYRSALSKAPHDKGKIDEKFKNVTLEDALLSDKYAGVMIDYLHAKNVSDKEGKPIGRTRFDRFMDIQLVVHGMDDVRKSLKAYIEPEMMDGDNQWYCEALDKKVDAVKGIQFKTFPDILTLHLKRFDYDRRTWQPIKLGHKVAFPFDLDMSPYLTTMEAYKDQNKIDYVYELYSVMIHSGSVNAGHYYAYIKDFESDNWYEFNDSRVSPITTDDIKKMYGDDDGSRYHSTNAYMLMYRRKGTSENVSREELIKKIPEEILHKIEEENVEFDESAKAYEKQQSMMKVNVYYKLKSETTTVIKLKDDESSSGSSSDSDSDDQIALDSMFEPGPTMSYSHHSVLRGCQKIPFNIEKSLPLKDFLKQVREKLSQYDFWGDHAIEDIRLRESDHDALGRCFDGQEDEPLSSLNLSEWTPLYLQTKPSGEDWPVEHRSIPLHVEFFTDVEERNMPYQSFNVNPDDTLLAFKKLILEERPSFAKSDDLSLLLLTKREYRLSKCDTYVDQDDKVLERDLSIEEHDRFLAEWVSSPTEESPAIAHLKWKEASVGVNFSHPDDPESFSHHLRIDKTKSVAELKAALSAALSLDDSRIRLWSHSRSKVFRASELEKSITSSYLIYDNCNLKLDIGDPFSSNDFMLDVYYYDSKEALRKRLDESKKKNQEYVAAGVTTRSRPVAAFRERYNLPRYFSNQEFTKIDSFHVSSTQPLSELRASFADRISVDPSELRIRLKKQHTFAPGAVLVGDDSPIGSLVSLSERTSFCISHVPSSPPISKGDVLVSVYLWNRGAWKLGPPFEFIFHPQSDDSSDSFKKQLLDHLGDSCSIPIESLGLTTAPYGFSRFHRKECSMTADRPFESSYEHLLSDPLNLSDGDILLYCDLRIPKREIPTTTAVSSSSSYPSIHRSSSSSSREPSLKISTEFDDDFSSDSPQKKLEDNPTQKKIEEEEDVKAAQKKIEDNFSDEKKVDVSSPPHQIISDS